MVPIEPDNIHPLGRRGLLGRLWCSGSHLEFGADNRNGKVKSQIVRGDRSSKEERNGEG